MTPVDNAAPSRGPEPNVDPSAPTVRARPAAAAAVAAVAALEAVTGWFRLFSWFEPLGLDDEGYVVLTVREWVDRGELYDGVASQYGPLHTLVFGLPLRLTGVELSLTAGRLITLGLIVAASALLACAVIALTGNLWAGLFAQIGAFVLFGAVESESMHPIALLALLMAGLVLTVARRSTGHAWRADMVAGALVASMALTKANVGAFAILALGYAVATSAEDSRSRRWIRVAFEAGIVLVGPVLLVPHTRELSEVTVLGPAGTEALWNWTVAYIAAALAVVALSRMASRTTDRTAIAFSLRALGAGFAAVVVTAVVGTLATGTSPAGLVDGAIVRPTTWVGGLTILPEVPRAAYAWLLLLPAFLILVQRWRAWEPTPPRLVWSGVVRLAAAAGVAVTCLEGPLGWRPIGFGIEWTIVLLPLVTLVLVPPLGASRPRDLATRQLIAVFAVVGSLHAFPIRGAQAAWSSAFIVLIVAVLVSDGGRELARARTGSQAGTPAHLALLPAFAALLILAVASFFEMRSWVDRYQDGTPLGLRGAAGIRATESTVANTRNAVDVLDGCDIMVSSPGIGSLHVFTATDPPTGYNVTAWELLLTDDEQREIVEAIDQDDALVCYYRLTAYRPLSRHEGPLTDHLQRFATPIASGDGWEILVEEGT